MSSEELGDVGATHDLARRLAAPLQGGDVVALVGDLGAGKTEFTRGLVAALGTPEDVLVTSPTYVLLNIYRGGRLDVAHFDAYVMDDEDDLERGGLHDLRREGHLIVVEWADRVAEALPEDTLWLELVPAGPGGARRATWRGGRAP